MEEIRNIKALEKFKTLSTGSRMGLVPTMGALHEGHLSLIRVAREAVGENGIVMLSLFVNPLQFNNSSDLTSYPVTIDEDLKKCREEGVDAVFFPDAEEMYLKDQSVQVSESVLSKGLCGAARPGHFDGVCTVILKLYHLCGPDLMVFGKKDFQQLAVIKRMVRDLNIPVEILGGETVREESGLALSSRNLRLTTAEKKDAAEIQATLRELKDGLEKGRIRISEVKSVFQKAMNMVSTKTEVDYVELVDAETLAPVQNGGAGRCTLGVAVFFNEVRLIDHITVDLT